MPGDCGRLVPDHAFDRLSSMRFQVRCEIPRRSGNGKKQPRHRPQATDELARDRNGTGASWNGARAFTGRLADLASV